MTEDNLSIKPFYIQTVYDLYLLEDKFKVNRKYQRKLVWSIDEKRQFIDSISKKYPIPLILLASISNNYEIIDGMQRLNAIFSFIEGEFGLFSDGKELYFDLATMPTTNELLDKQKTKQRQPVMDRTLCRQIANYELPFSVASFKDQTKIEDIFKRINSNGKHLSDHELRQAGALGKFPDLVRILSTEIRRDSSPGDILSLSKMKEISLSNQKLPYGINLFDVFWVKQEIIPIYNMRLSRDEEVIAYILVYIILGRSVNPSKANLDNFYKFNPRDIESEKLSALIENEATKIGDESIKSRFRKVFSEIELLLNQSKKSLRIIIFGENPVGLVRSFQVIFLAFYELIINEKMKINSYQNLLKSMDGIGSRHLKDIDSSNWGGKFRDEKIKAISGVIREHFVKDDKIDDPALDSWTLQLENLLNQSKIEQQQFDFKIGFHRLDSSANFIQNTLDKVIKTLTSMANNGPMKKGYIIVGVADNDADANLFESLYNVKSSTYNDFKITGIDQEANKTSTLSNYFSKLRDVIKNQPIEDYTKDYILQNMRLINYYDKSLLVFEIESTTKPLLYDKKYYCRKASSVEEIQPENYSDLFAKYR
jgi:hypothetical protein